MHDLGTPDSAYPWTYATALNDKGDVVGNVADRSGIQNNSFLYTNGVMQLLPLSSSSYSSSAYGINNLGQIVGGAGFGSYFYRVVYPVMWQNNSLTSVGWQPGTAFGINDAGQIVGGSTSGAFIKNGTNTTTYSGGYSGLTAINASGKAVGWVGYSLIHAYSWPDGADLDGQDSRFSQANAINASSQVVGWLSTPNGERHAFLWQKVSGMVDLNSLVSVNSGWTLTEATGINNYGQICGNGVNPNGLQHAFLLAPKIHIGSVKMVNSHTLHIQAEAYIDAVVSSKSLVVSFSLNGVPVQQSWVVPEDVSGTVSHGFDIDLVQAHVPRFKDNQVFSVTAHRNEDGDDVVATLNNIEIPLPVVYVHGILADATKDIVPRQLFGYLQGSHLSYEENDSLDDLGPDTGYPTLVCFDYHSMQDTVEIAGLNLASWIETQVKPHTYADRVNIVSHSKGGIISRAAIAYDGAGQTVNKLILIGSPSEGALIASLAYANFHSFLNEVGNFRSAIQYPTT